MGIFFGWLALFLTLCSAVVHLLALAGNKSAMFFPNYFLLWVSMLLVVGLPFNHIAKKYFKGRYTVAAFRAALPVPCFAIGVLLFGWLVYNFIVEWVVLEGGAPAIVDGKYVLAKGTLVRRELSSEEFIRLSLLHAQFLSIFFTLAYFQFAAFLLWRKAPATSATGSLPLPGSA